MKSNFKLMDSNKGQSFQTPIFEGADGNKYAVNPFATGGHLNQPENESNEKGSLFCSQCDLPFLDLIEYEHHNVELHGRKKILTCNFCSSTFRRQDHLKRHVDSVHEEHRYCICPVCGKNCNQQDILQKHIKRKHSTTSEIFNCRACSFQCGTLSDLEIHEAKHIFKDKRHVCPECNAGFKRRDHMLRHMKSRHSNSMFQCPICRQTYKRKDHVSRHVREKHKMGLLNGRLITSSFITQQNEIVNNIA